MIFLEAVSDLTGISVFCDGREIGKVTDVIMDMKEKKVKGLKCRSNFGILRTQFFVKEKGIIRIDKNSAEADKKYITYGMKEEFAQSGFGIYRDNGFFAGSVGDIYIDTETRFIDSVSVKKGFIDDIVYGRESFDAKDISLTNKGLIIVNRE